LILYDNGNTFAILDLNKNVLFSKSFIGKTFTNIEWSHDSTFFIATTDTNVYLFNMYDFSNKQWSNFQNKIKVNLKKFFIKDLF